MMSILPQEDVLKRPEKQNKLGTEKNSNSGFYKIIINFSEERFALACRVSFSEKVSCKS